ncbi:MAG: hypothetical protein IT317_20010 [Anaerolineales bacterium]|nr:hypothetical protein [Anaerolineales bacterium]
MRQSQSQANTLLLLVAVLAVIGGLVIVAVTSPQSFQLDRLFGGQPTRPAATATFTPTAAPTDPAPTETPIVTPTRRPTLAPALVTSTPTVTATPDVSPTPAPTEVELPADAIGLAEVQAQEALNGRVRDLPGGSIVVAVVPNGEQVYVLPGQQVVNDVTWLEVRLMDGQTTGWMADFLLKLIYTRP